MDKNDDGGGYRTLLRAHSLPENYTRVVRAREINVHTLPSGAFRPRGPRCRALFLTLRPRRQSRARERESNKSQPVFRRASPSGSSPSSRARFFPAKVQRLIVDFADVVGRSDLESLINTPDFPARSTTHGKSGNDMSHESTKESHIEYSEVQFRLIQKYRSRSRTNTACSSAYFRSKTTALFVSTRAGSTERLGE